MSDGFFEDDEPVDKIKAAFAVGEKGLTTPAVNGKNMFFSAPGVGIAPASDNHTTSEPVAS